MSYVYLYINNQGGGEPEGLKDQIGGKTEKKSKEIDIFMKGAIMWLGEIWH